MKANFQGKNIKQNHNKSKKVTALRTKSTSRLTNGNVKKNKVAIVLTCVLLGYFAFLFSTQYVRHLSLNRELQDLREEVTRVEKENEELMKKKELLTDPQSEYIEEIARKELGMVRDGEFLFNINVSD